MKCIASIFTHFSCKKKKEMEAKIYSICSKKYKIHPTKSQRPNLYISDCMCECASIWNKYIEKIKMHTHIHTEVLIVEIFEDLKDHRQRPVAFCKILPQYFIALHAGEILQNQNAVFQSRCHCNNS